MNKLAEAYVTVRVDATNVGPQLTGVTSLLQRVAGGWSSAIGGASMFGVKVWAATYAVKALSGAMSGMVSSMTSASASWQSMAATLGVLMGSAGKAKAVMEDMERFSASTPMTTEQLVQGVQSLKSYGMTDALSVSLTKSMSNVAASRPGEMDLTMSRLSRALGQIHARGKLAGQEVLQLTEAGINAGEAISKEMGVSVPEALKLVERGAVSAAVAIRAVQRQMDERYGGVALANASTFAGATSTLEDAKQRASRLAFGGLTDQAAKIQLERAKAIEAAAPQYKLAGEQFAIAAESIAGLFSSAETGVASFTQLVADIAALPGNLASIFSDGMAWLKTESPWLAQLVSLDYEWMKNIKETFAFKSDRMWGEWVASIGGFAGETPGEQTRKHVAAMEADDAAWAANFASNMDKQDAEVKARGGAKVSLWETANRWAGLAPSTAIGAKKQIQKTIGFDAKLGWLMGDGAQAAGDLIAGAKQKVDIARLGKDLGFSMEGSIGESSAGQMGSALRQAIQDRLSGTLESLAANAPKAFTPQMFGDSLSRFSSLQSAALTSDPAKQTADEMKKARETAEKQLAQLDKLVEATSKTVRFAAP